MYSVGTCFILVLIVCLGNFSVVGHKAYLLLFDVLVQQIGVNDEKCTHRALANGTCGEKVKGSWLLFLPWACVHTSCTLKQHPILQCWRPYWEGSRSLAMELFSSITRGVLFPGMCVQSCWAMQHPGPPGLLPCPDTTKHSWLGNILSLLRSGCVLPVLYQGVVGFLEAL